jgi:hypothetical protein
MGGFSFESPALPLPPAHTAYPAALVSSAVVVGDTGALRMLIAQTLFQGRAFWLIESI